jgi:hypothetical protein
MAQEHILVSGAWLWYAPEDEPLPDETSIDAGEDWGGNWEWAGFTTEPLTMNVEAETFEVDVQQLSAPIMQSITSETYTLSTTLAEQTAELIQLLDGGNIIVTPAGASQRGYTELKAGGRTVRTVHSVGFEVKRALADGTLVPLRLFFHRATFSRAGDTPYGKGEVAGMPIEIQVLADDAQAEDEKYYIWQRVDSLATTE